MTKGLANQRPESLEEPDKGAGTLTPLTHGDKLYDGIVEDFKNAGLIVTDVFQLENHFLWRRFKNEKDQFDQERKEIDPHFDINERYLYHGTNGNKEIFKDEEIDHRLSNKGCFGTGIYFSDNPKKCAKYAERGQEESFILLHRVLLGESKVYPRGKTDRELKREPKKENPGRGARRYDSVEGTPTSFREFVIYEKRRAQVECIITFKRSTEETPSASGDASSSTAQHSQPPVCPSDITLTEQHQTNDSDTSTSDDEDFHTPRDDEGDTTDEEELPADSDTTDDEENEDDECSKTKGIPPIRGIDQAVLEAKMKEFMDETKEDDALIARLYVAMENCDVATAIKSYNTILPEVEYTEEEEKDMLRITEEVESQIPHLNSEALDPATLQAMSEEDREAAVAQLVEQFCAVVGLCEGDKGSKPTGVATARKYLAQTKWEADLAVLTYLEDLYGLS